MEPVSNIDCTGAYARIRTRLTWASFVGAIVALPLHFVLGKTKWQASPLVAIDGVSPMVFSSIAIAILVSLVVFIFIYWKCPNCQTLLGMSVQGNKFEYTFDLKSCPKCQVSLRK